MTTDRTSGRMVLLAALAVMFVVGLVAWRSGGAGTPATVAAGATPAAPAAAEKASPVADVRLELLQSGQRELDEPTRNPFQFKTRAAAPAQAGPRFTAPVIISSPPPPPPAVPGPRPIALKFIGVLETSQGRLAVFKDASGEIFNGAEGDVLDGRFQLLKINPESADVAYADGRGRQTIRLSGQ